MKKVAMTVTLMKLSKKDGKINDYVFEYMYNNLNNKYLYQR